MGSSLLKKKRKSTKYCESLTESQEQDRLSHPPFNHLSLEIWRVFYFWGAQPTDMGSHVSVLHFFLLWMNDDHHHHQRSELTFP